MPDAHGRLTESQRAMAEALPHMVWTATPEGVVDYISAEFERITGMVGLNYADGEWLHAVHPDDHQPTLDVWQRSIDTGEPYDTEFRILHAASGIYRWHYVAARPSRDASGNIVQWFGSTVDIHDTIIAEARFRSIYSMVPVGVLEEDWTGVRSLLQRLRAQGVTDMHAWCKEHPGLLAEVARAVRITDANPAAVRLFQAESRKQLLGCLGDVFPGVEQGDGLLGGFLTFAHEASYYEAEVQLPTLGNELRHVLLRVSFPTHSSDTLSVISCFTDVTRQRQLEEQLRRSQRLEAIGQMTGGIAHDFNNLLTVILGNAELLSEELVAEPRLRALADMTLQTAERGAELISRLLAFARRQPLSPAIVNVNDLMAGMDALFRRTVGETIELQLRAQAGLWPTLIDATQLESAVLNLCLNSRDAMPSGGCLRIETANVVLQEPVELDQGILPAGDYVLLEVADTGCGMNDATAARAFEPFFTTKDIGKGSGLGLSMVYGFVRQSGGGLLLKTQQGQGTTVQMYFPRSHARRPAGG